MTVSEERRRRRQRDLVSRAWRYLAAERRILVGLAVLAVLGAQAESGALVLIAMIAESAARGSSDVGIAAGPINLSMSIPVAGLVASVAIVVAACLVFANRYLSARISARLELESRDEMVASFAGSDWEYQSTQKSSRVQGRLLRLMDARAVTFVGLVGWTRALTTIMVFVTVSALMSLPAAVGIIMFGAILSLAVLPIRRRLVRLSGLAADAEVGLAVDVAEAADHGGDVHVFGAWPSFVGRFAARSRALRDVRIRVGMARSLMPVVYQYGALALILGVMLVATSAGGNGEIGAFAATALLLLRSVQYGQQLQTSLQHMAESIPRIELMNRELAVPPPRVVPGDRLLIAVERVELRDVWYQYPDSVESALRNVSLDLRPGTIVGVAGPSGSGKSTLAQVLLRLRWPTSGEYLVNELPADEYSTSSWSRAITHVPQQPHLLHGSLAENVSFLDGSISRSDIEASLAAVGLDGIRDELEGGLDATLGPTGRSLSGGQVQRLGIARALVREPKLIVLDEPTSALDVNAERIVGEALAALRGRSDVLVIVIAHRPSTLALCDEMIVLENGEVVAVGSTRDLAQKNGFLTTTWGETQ